MTIATQSTSLSAPEIARAAGVNPVDYLEQRGFVQDVTDAGALRQAFADGIVTAYVGFDPTATSLHVGHLLGIMMLATLQRFGHRPIALGGGGTAMVGDPTGKTATRAVLSIDTIRENLQHILRQFDRHIDFEGNRFDSNPPALLLNNADWLLELKYIDFLRDIGRHFSVNEMLASETYKVRLESTGLNFVEFNYRLVQAYDFLYLNQHYGCLLQMGGSDQWGNIVAGVDLIRRVEGVQAFGLVCPLLTTSSGQKMGKTEGNSVWLDPEQTSPYDFYQYWMNAEDDDVPRFLRLYTFLPEDQISELTSVEGEALREAKRVLAWEATALTHGEAAASEAQAAADVLFGHHDLAAGDWVDDPSLPTTEIPASEVEAGMTIADLFVRAGLASSRRDARRTAAQGGLSISDARVEDVDQPFTGAASALLLRAGKKRFRRIVVS
ncbi:MAG: tyrosine--tRNA ligase [Thermomicrobiales bacterium]